MAPVPGTVVPCPVSAAASSAARASCAGVRGVCEEAISGCAKMSRLAMASSRSRSGARGAVASSLSRSGPTRLSESLQASELAERPQDAQGRSRVVRCKHSLGVICLRGCEEVVGSPIADNVTGRGRPVERHWRLSFLLLACAAALLVLGGPAAAATGKGSSQVRAGTRVQNNMTTLKAGTVLGRPTTASSQKVAPSIRRAPSFYTVVSSGAITNLNGGQTHGIVNCPAGLVAWGGGGFGSSTSTAQAINSSYPLVSNGVAVGWAVDMNNGSGSDSSFFVYAVCASKAKKYSVQSASFTDAIGTQTSGSVQCPIVNATTGKRSKALGGGVFGSLGGLGQTLNTSIPSNNNTWRIDENNATAITGSHTVYAVCGNRTGFKRVIGAAVTNAAGAQTGASVACPSGTVETGGGAFSSSASTAVSMNSTYPFTTGWAVFENNASASSATITPYAVCVG
jgi:hypothetical protein